MAKWRMCFFHQTILPPERVLMPRLKQFWLKAKVIEYDKRIRLNPLEILLSG